MKRIVVPQPHVELAVLRIEGSLGVNPKLVWGERLSKPKRTGALITDMAAEKGSTAIEEAGEPGLISVSGQVFLLKLHEIACCGGMMQGMICFES